MTAQALGCIAQATSSAAAARAIFPKHGPICFLALLSQIKFFGPTLRRAQRLTSDYRPAGPTASSLPFVRPKNGNAHRLFPCPRAGRGSINRDDPERDIITYSGLPAPRRPTSQAGPLPFKPAGGIAGGRDIFPRSGVGEQVGYFLYTTSRRRQSTPLGK